MINWINQIDRTTNELTKLFGSLTSKQLNWKPNPETWSIAQNMDHIIVINQSYFPILSDLKKGSYKLPFIAKIGFLVSILGKILLKAVNPDRRKKMKTFSIWEPSKREISDDILDKFKSHQTELKQQIEGSEDLIKRGAIISSPANKYIVYKLETAFDIIVTHEQRHLEQAKEILALLKLNTSSIR
ncbi:MAG: DinB family protein [Balneolales bacterium]